MITRPQDCALALAIPLTEEDFLHGLRAGEEKDFAKSLVRNFPATTEKSIWENKYQPIVRVAQTVTQAVKKHGVTVVQNATLAAFQDLLPHFQVITLVAHWRSHGFEIGEIEFFDRLQSVNEVNAVIPLSYEGILDFSVCHSRILGNAIKRGRRCLVITNDKEATPVFRLLIYKGTIELLAHHPMDYPEATTKVRKEFINQSKYRG